MQTANDPRLKLANGRSWINLALAGVGLAPGVNATIAGKAYPPFHGISLELLDTLLSPVLGIQLQMLVDVPVFKEMKSCTIDVPRREMWVEWLE